MKGNCAETGREDGGANGSIVEVPECVEPAFRQSVTSISESSQKYRSSHHCHREFTERRRGHRRGGAAARVCVIHSRLSFLTRFTV
jgi:hypothetical protein